MQSEEDRWIIDILRHEIAEMQYYLNDYNETKDEQETKPTVKNTRQSKLP